MSSKMLAICFVFATILPAQATTVTLKLAVEPNYPPYAFSNATTGALEGFGKDIADGMTALCSNFAITVISGKWADCWSSSGGGSLGAKIADGTYDGCMTYTHTHGVRDKLADFSYGILNVNKAAGLLTRLSGGNPVVTGLSDLGGKKVADIGGWAPTADGLGFVTNKCTGKKYVPKCVGALTSSCYQLHVANKNGTKVANDVGLEMLLDGTVDAVFLYADQAYQYTTSTSCQAGAAAPAWNCSLWKGFGTTFTYVQTGQFKYAANGTTLAITKKGSGVPAKMNSCLQKYMETKAYYDVCVKHNLVSSCYSNSHFPKVNKTTKVFDKATNLQTGACSTGYCSCPATTTTTTTVKAAEGAVSSSPRGIASLSMCAFLFAYVLLG